MSPFENYTTLVELRVDKAISCGIAMTMSDKRIYVEQRPEGNYAVRKPGSDRASAVEPTQAKAIERARELNPGVAPHVERVRDTNVGGRGRVAHLHLHRLSQF
jgi:hypothetical protein